jgi:GlpG protein
MDLATVFRRYPINAALSLLATVASLALWAHRDIALLTVDYHVWSGQIWRPLTSTLPHVNPPHLIFNLYWLWRFGTRIERAYGPWRTAALYAYLAFGSSLAEYVFAGQGVGLSGVVYGLFGYLWVVAYRDRRFWGAIDQQTIVLFVAWFFLCIYLTVKNIMPIGNFAHGGGLLLGVLCGWAVQRQFPAKWQFSGLLGAAIAVLVAAGTIARPYVNFTEFAGREFGAMGCVALEESRNEDAVRYFNLALDRCGGSWLWYDLGLAYQRLDRWEEAAAAYKTAARLKPDDAKIRDALASAQRRAKGDDAIGPRKAVEKAGSAGDGDSGDDGGTSTAGRGKQ